MAREIKGGDFKINFDKRQPDIMPEPADPGESTSLFNSDPNAPADAFFDKLDADSGSIHSDVPKEIRARENQARPRVPGDKGKR